jgi:hypothetical protein
VNGDPLPSGQAAEGICFATGERSKFPIQGRTAMIGFVIGAIAGGAAMWLYGDQIRGFLDSKTSTARSRAAEGLKTVAHTLEEGASNLERMRREGTSGTGTGRPAGRESTG